MSVDLTLLQDMFLDPQLFPRPDVLLHPLQGQSLILHAVVSSAATLCLQRLQSHESQGTKAVVHGHHKNLSAEGSLGFVAIFWSAQKGGGILGRKAK